MLLFIRARQDSNLHEDLYLKSLSKRRFSSLEGRHVYHFVTRSILDAPVGFEPTFSESESALLPVRGRGNIFGSGPRNRTLS